MTPTGVARVGVPDDIVLFQTKPQIALDQLRAARAAGIAAELAFWPTQATATTLTFAMASPKSDCPMPSAFQSTTTLWAPGSAPLPPKQWSGRGRPTSSEIRRTPSISRSRPSNWLWLCPSKLGGG